MHGARAERRRHADARGVYGHAVLCDGRQGTERDEPVYDGGCREGGVVHGILRTRRPVSFNLQTSTSKSAERKLITAK